MTKTSEIEFESKPFKIKDLLILRLPEDASLKLPSRGQVAVEGVVGSHKFCTVLEPDGYFGHWMRIDNKLQARFL